MRHVYLLLWLLLLVGGCTKPAAQGCKVGGTAVGETWAHYATYREDLLVVVWSDISSNTDGSRTASSSSISADSVELDASRESDSGQAVKWKVVTTDGKSGTVTLNGKDYRLEDGALFLVQTRNGPVKVTQVKHDIAGIKPTDETWKRLAKDSPEVKAFLAQASDKK